MPVWDVSAQGFTFQPDDSREQVVINETFRVEAGQESVFENKIVWVRPGERKDIEVYARLVIRDSLLLWDQSEH